MVHFHIITSKAYATQPTNLTYNEKIHGNVDYWIWMDRFWKNI